MPALPVCAVAHKNKDRMLLNIVEVIGGLVLLIWGADRFVHGAAATARNLGIAPLLIGLTIVAFATSAPEILVSIVAALRGEPDLAFGNAGAYGLWSSPAIFHANPLPAEAAFDGDAIYPMRQRQPARSVLADQRRVVTKKATVES